MVPKNLWDSSDWKAMFKGSLIRISSLIRYLPLLVQIGEIGQQPIPAAFKRIRF